MALDPSHALRVLLIAEACNQEFTSVPLLGYNYARALGERDDLEVTLVTHVRNRAALKGDGLASHVRLDFIDNEWIAAPLYRLARLLRRGDGLSWTINTAMAWPSYIVFEKMVYKRFQRPLRQGHFDLIHRITPLTPTVGSPLAKLTKIPMIVGPLNGGLPWPTEYPELRRQEREWLVPLRAMYKHLPYYRTTYQHLAGVIHGSRHTATEVPRWFRGLQFYLPENGVDPGRFPLSSAWPEPQGRFRFLTTGRLVPYKGFDLILEAMEKSKILRSSCELLIVGEGPERTHLESISRRSGLCSNVTFAGWLTQSQLARELGNAQAFVFPSLREFGGAVVLEALASGLPAIVVDYGGPGELVTPECGILLRMQPRDKLVAELREGMESLALDAARCRALSRAAFERVRKEFTWVTKAARIVAIYREVLEKSRTSSVHRPETY